MTRSLRALVVGADLEEISALHQFSRQFVGSQFEMLALEADPSSSDPELAWGTKHTEVRQLPSDPNGEMGPPIEQPLPPDGDTWRTILDAAHDHGAALIVIASHRQRWLRRILAGSAAHDLLDRTDLPILAVPATTLGNHQPVADR